jgi:predicted branched-subunit amino acid permease
VDRDQNPFWPGIRIGIPFGVAAFLVGISFGVVAKPVMGTAAPIVMSVIVFAGASQFGVTAVLASGGDAVTAIAAGVMLNTRFLPMGVAVSHALKGGPLRRALEGQALVDASWAAAHQGEGRFDRYILLGATLPQYIGWVVGTVIGVFSASLLGDPKALGLDAVFPAFFLGLLLAEGADSRAGRLTALLGAAIAFALTPFLPAGLPILLASLAALIGLRVR